MAKPDSQYVAKKPDANGHVAYTPEEDRTWQTLITRQLDIVDEYACAPFLHGLKQLNFVQQRIPQLEEVSSVLRQATGWEVYPVSALISYDKFFRLLANRQFPAATFIRRPDELDYLQEPDIFHELFGHCPLLTDPVYAHFMQRYGELGAQAPEADQHLYARLYWFTVEFGLLRENKTLRSYGGGILSSISETPYATESSVPERKPFNILDVLRTPYRIDILQTVYFIVDSLQELYDTLNEDLPARIAEARQLGEFEPTFPPKLETSE